MVGKNGNRTKCIPLAVKRGFCDDLWFVHEKGTLNVRLVLQDSDLHRLSKT